MPETITCSKCKGAGALTVLVSQHDDKTDVIVCDKCNGKGFTHQMTQEEENDYRADYW